jgi:hypothetical protein
MKASELRIGNYIQNSHGTISNVGIVMLGGQYDYHPIPLTEEWLLKFGFEQISDRVYIKNYHYGYEFGITNIFVIKNDNCFMRYKHIQYVHELQNLYFALTNEEL